jgi:hypothetical protein
MHELPKKVTQMPLNFFEKLDNVYQKQDLKQAISINGNMQPLLKNSNRIFEESRAEPAV